MKPPTQNFSALPLMRNIHTHTHTDRRLFPCKCLVDSRNEKQNILLYQLLNCYRKHTIQLMHVEKAGRSTERNGHHITVISSSFCIGKKALNDKRRENKLKTVKKYRAVFILNTPRLLMMIIVIIIIIVARWKIVHSQLETELGVLSLRAYFGISYPIIIFSY